MAWAWARRAAAFPRERPVVFGCVFSALKTAFADYLVQRHFEDRKELDLRRTAVFTLFGFGYLGGWQYFLYVKCFPRWFPAAAPFASKSIPDKLVDRAGQLAVAKQVATEALIHAPMLYFPCFYVLKESVETGNPSNAVAKLQINLRKDLVEYWKVPRRTNVCLCARARVDALASTPAPDSTHSRTHKPTRTHTHKTTRARMHAHRTLAG